MTFCRAGTVWHLAAQVVGRDGRRSGADSRVALTTHLHQTAQAVVPVRAAYSLVA